MLVLLKPIETKLRYAVGHKDIAVGPTLGYGPS